MMLGGDPGAGTSSAYDPEQRRICSYASGVILAVELADHYDTAIDIIRDETGEDSRPRGVRRRERGGVAGRRRRRGPVHRPG